MKKSTGHPSSYSISIFPHLEHEELPHNTLEAADQWAKDIGGLVYAIDGATAIKIIDKKVEVVLEGKWKKYGV